MTDKVRWILGVWRPIRGWVPVLLLLTAVSTGVTLAYPLVLRRLIDAVQRTLAGGADAEGTGAGVTSVVLLLVAVAFGRFAAHLYPAARAYLNTRIDRAVRETYFDLLLRKGHGFFLRFRTGDLVTRLTDDIGEYPRIAWFCCSGLFRALDSAAKLVFCLGVMLWLDTRLALLGIAPLPVMLGTFLLAHRRLGRHVAAHRRAISETNDVLESSFSGVRILKAYNAEPRQADALRRQLERRAEVELDLVRMQQLVHALQAGFSSCGQVLVLGVGSLLVLRGQVSAGTLYAFYAYLGMLSAPLLDLPNLLIAGRQAFVSIDRVEEIRTTDRAEEGGALRGARPIGRFESLRLDGVRFGYGEGASEVLRGVDLELHSGESVAVVGCLGAGKSTLLRLAAGMLTPGGGRVLLDGRPLAEYGARDFGRAVGLVPQDPVLLRGSVRENVVFGRPEDPARLEAVLEAVGLGAETAALPQGLEQDVGLRGASLSGGQRQRVTIARALYGAPQLLLLDDLTSALDAQNEDRLWRSLQRLVPGVTILCVTHRVATARAMHRICVLDGGRIAESGSHEALLLRSALYREFQHLAAERDGAIPLESLAAVAANR